MISNALIWRFKNRSRDQLTDLALAKADVDHRSRGGRASMRSHVRTGNSELPSTVRTSPELRLDWSRVACINDVNDGS